MITPIQLKPSTPTFGTFFHDVYDVNGDMRYRGDTKICRDDLYFPDVVDFLENKYKNVQKVNVLMHACSDGEEVYSFLGVLISKLGRKAEKYLPIKAKDIDSEHLKLAKRGVYQITKSEYLLANDCMGGNFYNYFELIPNRGSKDPRLKYTSTVKVEHSMKSLVNFSQGNILEDVKKLDLKNTVLFARNFWPYLTSEERIDLVQTLSEKADNSFTLIVGDFDSMGNLLMYYGFNEVAENVFEKPKNKPNKNFEFYKNYYHPDL